MIKTQLLQNKQVSLSKETEKGPQVQKSLIPGSYFRVLDVIVVWQENEVKKKKKAEPKKKTTKMPTTITKKEASPLPSCPTQNKQKHTKIFQQSEDS